MRRFPLHDLNNVEFEDLVVRICREILGKGTTSFEKGPDGGKDAKFVGIANCFPSESGPLNGTAVIQAKHTTDPTKSCSDNDFAKNDSSTLNKEIPKIKRQVENESVTHYLLFTNRRKTGRAETEIPSKIQAETGVKQAWLVGNKDIQDFLIDYPKIANDLELHKLRLPIQFTPHDIRDVISAFFDHRETIADSFDSQHDFRDYPGIERKNEINNLTNRYFRYIQEKSLPRFNQIERFLKNPRNSDLTEKYHAVADEFKGQIIVHQDSFARFDDALEQIYQLIHKRSRTLKAASHRRLVKIFVHYMYCNCDIGENVQ